MKNKIGILSRIKRALESFTISYAFVIIIYVLISSIGIFDPIDNEMALQLMGTCLVIAVVHFFMGFWEIRSYAVQYFLYFGVVAAAVLFMGGVVYRFFIMNVTFFICLAVMLVVVFSATYLITYYDDWKKIQEINEMIRENRK